MVLIAVLTIMVPLILLVGAYASTMVSRNRALIIELDAEVALLAAEAGIDEAIHQGRIGALVDGSLPQRRLLDNAPVDIQRELLTELYEGALSYW